MAKETKANEEKKYGAPANALASDAYPEKTVEPDAKFYAVQPTSYEVNQSVVGEVPADRFQEQVLKSEAGANAVDSHPPENQPQPGVPGDEKKK